MNPSALPILPARRAAPGGLLPARGNPIRHVAGDGVILRDRRETGVTSRLLRGFAQVVTSGLSGPIVRLSSLLKLPGASALGLFRRAQFGT